MLKDSLDITNALGIPRLKYGRELNYNTILISYISIINKYFNKKLVSCLLSTMKLFVVVVVFIGQPIM